MHPSVKVRIVEGPLSLLIGSKETCGGLFGLQALAKQPLSWFGHGLCSDYVSLICIIMQIKVDQECVEDGNQVAQDNVSRSKSPTVNYNRRIFLLASSTRCSLSTEA